MCCSKCNLSSAFIGVVQHLISGYTGAIMKSKLHQHIWYFGSQKVIPLVLKMIYRKISNIRHTNFPNLNFSRLGLYLSLPVYWSQVLNGKWRCSWSSANRWCSNYIWVINNLIAYYSASSIRHFTVFSGKLGQYHGRWYPGSLCCQNISSHGSENVRRRHPCQL